MARSLAKSGARGFDQAQTLLHWVAFSSGYWLMGLLWLHQYSALMTVVALPWRSIVVVNTYSCCFWCKHWLINRLGK